MPRSDIRAANETPPRLAQISERMKSFVAANEVAGAVTLVATRDKTLHLDAVGYADIATKTPMKQDTIFWIASMTKPVTATAVMMLADEGKLSVDDPVAKYIPELGTLALADGSPANVTIAHVLTHTSGMADISEDESRQATTLAEVIPFYASKPVAFEPGGKWSYCQSGINTAGRIVEVVSGKSFPEFLEERLFKPLGMSDTIFYLSEEQMPRLATPYKRNSGGELEATQNFILLGKSPTSRDRFPGAHGGLFSTAGDYARFCRMIAGGGELDGRRYLSARAVGQMTTPRTGDLATGFTPGNAWGLGWCVVREPQGATSKVSAGTFGHGGAYGTQAWIDPKRGAIYLLMVQRANFPNADASDVRQAFQEVASDEVERGAGK